MKPIIFASACTVALALAPPASAQSSSWEDPAPATVVDARRPTTYQTRQVGQTGSYTRQPSSYQTRQVGQQPPATTTSRTATAYQTRQVGQQAPATTATTRRPAATPYRTRQVGQPAYTPPPQQPVYQQPAQPVYTPPPQQPTYQQPVQPVYTPPPQRPAYQQPSYDQPVESDDWQSAPPPPSAPYVDNPGMYEYGTESIGYRDDLFSQHLDAKTRRLYSYGGTYVSETQFGTYGVTEMAEADIEFRLFRFDGFFWGSIDAWAVGHGIYFIDNPGLEAIPDALIDAGIDLGVWWRFVNGWSTEIRAVPGVYSDVTAPAFGIPLTFNLYYAFHPTLSLKLGATFRPGWDIPVMPSAGLAWEPIEEFRVEAMLPQSRIVLFPNHRISLFGTFEWRNVTYALDDENTELPDSLTLDDMLVTAGISLSPFGDYALVGEVGQFIGRELSADVEKDKAIDLSDETFFRIMLKGSF